MKCGHLNFSGNAQKVHGLRFYPHKLQKHKIMKKIVLVVLTGLISNFSFSQTATNFNCNDCSDVNHDLFTELNAGKVVVIVWVMPCGACIGPALSAYNEVQNYSASHPERVLFYLADDLGNTSCSTMTGWANTNGMRAADAIFSNAMINMTDYGAAGMPKIVVIGGSSHTVFYNQEGAINVTNFDNAINQALVTGIRENSKADFKMVVFPNPSTTNTTTVTYDLTQSIGATIDIYNTLGVRVKSIVMEKQVAGKHETPIDLESLSNGVYFIKLNVGDSSQVIPFTVTHS